MLGFIVENISFRGRASRVDFWLVVLLGPLVVTAIMALSLGVLGRAGMVPTVISILLFAVVKLGVEVRRLHDRDLSGHWMWIFSGIPALLSAVARIMPGSSTVAFCASVSVIVALWGLVELGFLGGTEGSNRFGNR